MKFYDRIEIEESVELLVDVWEIIFSNYTALSIDFQNVRTISILNLSNRDLKGILFEVYSKLGDKEGYNKIN